MSSFLNSTTTKKSTSSFLGGSSFNSSLNTGSSFLGTKKPKTSGTEGLDLETLLANTNIPVPDQTPKLSLLGRAAALLGSFETGNAVYTGMEKGVKAGAGSYVKGIGEGIASAVMGKDYGQSEKKSYKDVVEKIGVKNGIAKFGLGLVGDIFLDPSTYLGGTAVKYAAKGTKGLTKVGLKGISKVAPEVATGLEMAAKGAQDAVGRAFKFGYGTSKGLPEKVLETTNDIAKSREGIIASQIRRNGTGTLSKSQSEELAAKLLEGKRAEFTGRQLGVDGKQQALDIAKSSDPVVQKAIDEQLLRSQKFAKQAKIEDPFSVYFPGIKNETVKKFFDSTKYLKVGSEGYKKEFKNLLKDSELVMNPAEAFAKVETEIAKNNIVRNQLSQIVKDFGAPLEKFASKDEALKAGYDVIKEKGMFGKEIGYLPQADKKFIDSLISPEFTTIDMIAKHTGFDAVTSLFKRSVTGLFPSFHVRNYVSGLLQNYEVLGAQALNPANIALGQRMALKLTKAKGSFGKEAINIGEKTISLNKLMKPFEKRFGGSSSYFKDIEDATAYTTKPLTKVKSLNPLAQDSLVFRKARAVGNFIETQQKATAYVTAIKKGSTVKEALDYATRAGFDYRALTGFESKVLRRIIPFYSFTRKNIELQLKTLGEHPERINNIIKIMRDAGNMSAEEQAQLPDYAKEQFTFKIGNDYVIGLGTPIEQMSTQFGENPIRRMAASLNPVFKLPLERAFGMDFFRNRPLSEVVEAGEYAKAPQFIKDFLQVSTVTSKTKDGKTKVTATANPYRLQLLRNMPTTRGATYVSAIFDERSNISKILSSLTGVKAKAIDLETVKYFKDRDNKKELEQLLIRAGVLKKYESVYKPKNSPPPPVSEATPAKPNSKLSQVMKYLVNKSKEPTKVNINIT